MEDIFSDISSISDCDEECILDLNTKRSRCVTIQVSQIITVFSLPPCYTLDLAENTSLKRTHLEEKSCWDEGCRFEQFDKWVQTDPVDMEVKMCFADLPPTNREAEYDESALERVLRHISAHLHRTQLEQWLAKHPERNASFHIRPVPINNVFKSDYNHETVCHLLFEIKHENDW